MLGSDRGLWPVYLALPCWHIGLSGGTTIGHAECCAGCMVHKLVQRSQQQRSHTDCTAELTDDATDGSACPACCLSMLLLLSPPLPVDILHLAQEPDVWCQLAGEMSSIKRFQRFVSDDEVYDSRVNMDDWSDWSDGSDTGSGN